MTTKPEETDDAQRARLEKVKAQRAKLAAEAPALTTRLRELAEAMTAARTADAVDRSAATRAARMRAGADLDAAAVARDENAESERLLELEQARIEAELEHGRVESLTARVAASTAALEAKIASNLEGYRQLVIDVAALHALNGRRAIWTAEDVADIIEKAHGLRLSNLVTEGKVLGQAIRAGRAEVA